MWSTGQRAQPWNGSARRPTHGARDDDGAASVEHDDPRGAHLAAMREPQVIEARRQPAALCTATTSGCAGGRLSTEYAESGSES